MFGDPFYHELLRKYVSIFGTIFNDIRIKRSDGTSDVQYFTIPLSYGPREKYWGMVSQKPDSKVEAIQLPRMSFEITGIEYDATRKVQRTQRVLTSNNNMMFEPVPFNINFQLNVMTKSTLDALKIVEQILPYFNPDWTVAAQLIEGDDRLYDIPVVLTSQSHTDAYDGDFATRRVLTWEFNFTLKGVLHGPIRKRKIIKFVRTNIFSSTDAQIAFDGMNSGDSITIRPGLTVKGQPTTDVNQSVDYHLINPDDNYAYIVKIEDINGN